MQYGKQIGVTIVIFAGLSLCPRVLPAQTPGQVESIADAARRARQKSNSDSKPPKVITDDDLDRQNFKSGQQGLDVKSPPKSDAQPPAPEAVAHAEAADKAAAAEPGDPAAKKDAGEKKLATLKEKLAEVAKQVDLLQRELALDQDTFFSNPDHQHDVAGKAKLDAEQQQINDKLPQLEELKAQLEQLRKELGLPSEPAIPPSQATTPQ